MDEEARVADILAAWREARERGEAPSRDEVLARHPDLSESLRTGFAVMRALEDAAAGRSRRQVPAAIGPYRIERELGRGGMGTVYLARQNGDRVALKLLHPHLLEREGFFRRFQREARLGREVDHPNVVRTFDCDLLVVDERPLHFLVMEYVEGRTLRELLRDLGRVPEALLREIASQVCAGLAAIHERGVVHRDLKPDNVLITTDQRVRIMDLGVARLLDATLALSAEGQFAGTLHYAAPERFRGGGAGPSSDLYALGVTLYELATGLNPFAHDEPSAAIHAHLHEQAPPADELEPALSPFTASVLATLLAKQPAARFGSAAELAAVLADGERSQWWDECSRGLRGVAGWMPQIHVRRDTRLCGRQDELELLGAAWQLAREGEGSVVLLTGEAGIGKTRLVDAFLTDLREEEVHVLYGSYAPSGGRGGLSDAVIERFGERALTDALTPYLQTTPSLVPAFAAVVAQGRPPRGADLSQEALHTVFAHLMQGLAAEKPLVWVVDDVHFAPADGRTLALSLARAVAGHRVLLLLSTRPGPAVKDLAHLSRLDNLTRVSLGRLSPREVIELLRGAFRSEALAVKLGGRIALKSDGVPFFVFEMIRGLHEGQFIEQLPDGSYVETRIVEEIAVPSAVRDLIGARLADLSQEQRALLDLGAVAGFEFDPDLVARVFDVPSVRVLQDLAEIDRRSGVVCAAGRRYRFDHHQIQEVVYGDLHEALREEYHAALAEALESREYAAERDLDELPGAMVADVCEHFLNGGRGARALPYLVPALDYLAAAYQNHRAVRLAERALCASGLVAGAARVEVALRLSDRLGFLGRVDDERAVLDDVLPVAESLGDCRVRARVLGAIGWHSHRVGHYDEARATLSAALEAASEIDDRRPEARLTAHLGLVLLETGEYATALEHQERAAGLFHDAGDRRGEATAAGNLGNVLRRQGRFAEALAQCDRQLALARELSDQSLEAAADEGAGLVLVDEGRFVEARAKFERALELARATGERGREATATGNLGVTYWHLGELALSRVHDERKLVLCREIGRRVGEANAAGNLGVSCLDEGRMDEACAFFEQHVAIAREIGDRESQARALANLGSALSLLGQSGEALRHVEAAAGLARELGSLVRRGYANLILAQLAERSGLSTEAEQRLRETVAQFRELGARGRLSGALASLGGLLAREARHDEARPYLEEAVTLAKDAAAPGSAVLPSCYLALRPDCESGEAARQALITSEHLLGHFPRMEASHALWHATHDPAHLAAAHRLLSFARDHAPEDCRDSMIENVPLHRDIMAAWREHGGSAAETAVNT